MIRGALSLCLLLQLLQRIDHCALTVAKAMRVSGEDGVLGVAGEFLDDRQGDVLRDQVGDVTVSELVEVICGEPQVSACAF